jgi:hypothetical protein
VVIRGGGGGSKLLQRRHVVGGPCQKTPNSDCPVKGRSSGEGVRYGMSTIDLSAPCSATKICALLSTLRQNGRPPKT